MSDRDVRMDAAMDGERVVVRNIGRKVKVSEMELVALATFARIGLLFLFTQIDGEPGEKAEEEMEAQLQRVREEFAKTGNDDGLNRLASSVAAMLGGDRLGKYVVMPEAKR